MQMRKQMQIDAAGSPLRRLETGLLSKQRGRAAGPSEGRSGSERASASSLVARRLSHASGFRRGSKTPERLHAFEGFCRSCNERLEG